MGQVCAGVGRTTEEFEVSGNGFTGLDVRAVSRAQVAEWLMAADCKSAAPWSYGGSNPPLCTRIVFELM